MSEIDSVGNSYYYSGVQNSTNHALKNQKSEKTSSTRRTKFSDILKTKDEPEPSFSTAGLPPEIKEMSLEEAMIFLKDRVDMAGNDLSQETSRENIDQFKKSVSQFITFVIANNFEVSTKRSRRVEFTSPVNMFSNYNTTPRRKDPKVQINIINEKLDMLTKETLKTQLDNFKILQQVDEIKGLIIDLMSS